MGKQTDFSLDMGHDRNDRAIVSKKDSQTYRVLFRAHYFGFMASDYEIELQAESDDKTLPRRFTGKENLGFLSGGTYTYKGEADAKRFFSTYTSKSDHGVFEMKRPILNSSANP